MRPLSSCGLASLLLVATACETGPLRWEPAASASDAPAAARDVDASALATLPTDARGARCEASLRIVEMTAAPAGAATTAPTATSAGAPAATDHAAMGHALPAGAPSVAGGAPDSARLVAVWWSVLPDSTARLVSARGTAGGASWEPTVVVDTLDRGARGCARPAPSVAWTPANRYVHVAYWLDAPEGPGVFYAHSMLAGRIYDTDPQPIAYGPRVGQSAVAARGDTVVVAYEDPNGREPAIVLAYSTTAGHGFADKAVPVSGGSFAASRPVVTLDGAGVVVAWSERQQARDVPMRRRALWAR